MTLHMTCRSLTVAAIALMTQACLFMVETPVVDTNNTNNTNNTNGPCFEVTCEAGQVCDDGDCVAQGCVFSGPGDGWQSSCALGSVCHLDVDGKGYCAPSCRQDRDCRSGGTFCDFKYDTSSDGGLCVPSGSTDVSCIDDAYSGLCTSDESCVCFDEIDESCFCEPGGVGVSCFVRPDEVPDPGNGCLDVACGFDDVVERDGPCAGVSEGVVLCHFNSAPFSDPSNPSSGYCDFECDDDDFCMEGAFCDLGEGRCVPEALPPGCNNAWEVRDPADGKCKLRLCDAPGTSEGDEVCARESGDSELRCHDSPFPGGSPGVCFPDCNRIEDEQGMACPSGPEQLTCGNDGLCRSDAPQCPESCGAGAVCNDPQVGCEESTLNSVCLSQDACGGAGESCRDVDGLTGQRCVLNCETDSQVCPVGSTCVMGPGGMVCAASCDTSADCGIDSLRVCSKVSDVDVCLPRRTR